MTSQNHLYLKILLYQIQNIRKMDFSKDQKHFKMLAKDFIKKVKDKEISVIKNTEKILKEAKNINKEYSYFNFISEEYALKQAQEIEKSIKQNKAQGSLLGLPISVKDCICTQSIPSSSGSKILERWY